MAVEFRLKKWHVGQDIAALLNGTTAGLGT
jgi:hypothetical protein